MQCILYEFISGTQQYNTNILFPIKEPFRAEQLTKNWIQWLWIDYIDWRMTTFNETRHHLTSPRFLCRPTTLYIFARAAERQSAIYTENSGFASPSLGQHISTFRGYRILFYIRNPYINRFTNHFFYSFITILSSESGVTLHYSTILP